MAAGKMAAAGLALAAALGGTGMAAEPPRAAEPPKAAEALDYAELFRTRGLNCMHPTVDAAKATVEVTKGPTSEGDVTTVRVKAFYAGLMKRNVLEADVMVRRSGSIRQMRIAPLSDTGTGARRCGMEKAWADF